MTTIIAPQQLITAFEQAYRHDHQREHGLLLDAMGRKIVERTGDVDEVEFSPQELERACMGFLDHNHPHGLPPSGFDLALAARYGLTLRAFGIIPNTGAAIDYTVRMPSPDDHRARTIEASFDNEVEQTRQSSVYEARHIAITRLADQLGFTYTRTPNTPVREMKVTHELQRLNVLEASENALNQDVFSPLLALITRTLTQHASIKGTIPLEQLDNVRQAVAGSVIQIILGKPSQNGLLQPYTTYRGKVIPNSAYFATLWRSMRDAASAAIAWHASIMRRYLPADLIHSFESASINPFEVSVHEMDEDIFPSYDPLHLWIGPDGKRLSDRIWNVAGELRRKLDGYLTDAIASSKPVKQIALDLEDYLLVGRTDTTWGNLSYEARRLAQTEVAAAHARADSAAAQLNPFVETYNFVTAPEHRCCDECDEVEAGSPYPKSDTSHLPPRHPFCICRLVWNMVKDIPARVLALRQQIEQAISATRSAFSDFIGPLSRKFIDVLFGERR